MLAIRAVLTFTVVFTFQVVLTFTFNIRSSAYVECSVNEFSSFNNNSYAKLLLTSLISHTQHS